MKKITLLKKMSFWISRNRISPRLILSPSTRLVEQKIPFYFRYKVRIVEQTFSISKTHEKCCLFSKRNINDFLANKFSYLHIGLVQVVVKPLTRKCINASVLMCLRNARFKNFSDSILGMITASLYDGPIYFDCYPDISLTLDDPNIVKALTLNILTHYKKSGFRWRFF